MMMRPDAGPPSLQDLARQRAAARNEKAKALLAERPLLFLRALSPCWTSSCLPPGIQLTYPTPATAKIGMHGAAFTKLDAKYLQRRAELAPSFVKLPDGRLLSYFVDGKASGVPILLLHGNGSNKYRWVQKQSIKAVRLIAIDRPGYGDSSPAPPGYTAEAFVCDILALLNALAVGKVIVLGHSMGCLFGSILASALPTRVVTLVLCSPTLRCSGPLPAGVLSIIQENTAPTSRATRLQTAAARAADEFQMALDEQKATPRRYAAFAADPFWVSVQYDSFRCFTDDRRFLMANATDWEMTQRAQVTDATHVAQTRSRHR